MKHLIDKGTKKIMLDSITSEFLGSLNELRIMHGLKCRQVGEAIGKSERVVCEYVMRDTNPTLQPLMRLSEFFGADISGSVNYQYWHGQIDFGELRRELSENGLTHERLASLIPYGVHVICCSVNDHWKGNLECLSAVIEILTRAHNGEIFPRIVKERAKKSKSKLSCPDEITFEFMRKLKSLRVSKGLTLERLSRMIGVTKTMLVKYESCEYLPTVEVLMRLAEIFGYDISGSMNSQWFHGEIRLDKIKSGLSKYGLSYPEIGRFINYDKSTVRLAVSQRLGGSLKCLSGVIDVLAQERELSQIRNEICCAERKKKPGKKSSGRRV